MTRVNFTPAPSLVGCPVSTRKTRRAPVAGAVGFSVLEFCTAIAHLPDPRGHAAGLRHPIWNQVAIAARGAGMLTRFRYCYRPGLSPSAAPGDDDTQKDKNRGDAERPG